MQRPKRKDRPVSGELCVLVDLIQDSNLIRKEENVWTIVKRFAGFDENGYVVLEYMNEAVYPGKVR